MHPLFFAVGAASSEEAPEFTAENISLHPQSPGWRSGRCCTYPQELQIRLEYDSEVSEIVLAAPRGFAPSKVNVLLSVGHTYDGLLDAQYSSFGTAEFPSFSVTGSNPSVQKVAIKSFGLCSGLIRLVMHEPDSNRLPQDLTGGKPLNPYVQVGLLSVEIWGREGASAAKPKPPAVEPSREARDDVSRTLAELGIPLEILPTDEAALTFGDVDDATRRLLEELRCLKESLLNELKFGEAQQLQEQIANVINLGGELKEAQAQLAQYKAIHDFDQAEKLVVKIRSLEQQRLNVAAFFDTFFWEEAMTGGSSS